MSIVNFEKHFINIKEKLIDVKDAIESNATVVISDQVDTNLTKINGNTIASGSGVNTSGTMRVTIASNDGLISTIHPLLVQGNNNAYDMNNSLNAIETNTATLNDCITGGNILRTTLIGDNNVIASLPGSTNYVNATIVGTPNVSISNTPSITLSGSSNAVNATIIGTPAVTLSGSSNGVNATLVGTSAVSGTVAVSSIPSISGAVTLSGSSNAVNATIVGTPAVTIASNSSINLNQIAGTTTAVNSGVNSAGVQRVSIATDDLNIKRLTDNHIRLYNYTEWILIYQSDEEALVSNDGYAIGQYTNYMNNISGTTPTIATIKGFRTYSIAANSEYIYETRFMYPNYYNIMRYDFDICYTPLNTADVETTNYMEFGLRNAPYSSKTHANGIGSIYFRIYMESALMRLKCGFGNSSYNSVSNNFNIDTSTLPSLGGYNKWSIFLFGHGTVAIYGYWSNRNVFTPICNFNNIAANYAAGSNGTMCNHTNLKQYIHIYNNSANTYSNLIGGFSAYSPIRYHINNLLPYSVQCTSTFTHTSLGATREQICYIAYKAMVNIHQRFQIPIIAILSVYPSNMVICNIEYVSDCTPTLTSTVNVSSLLLKSDTNVSGTYTNLILHKKFCPANLNTDIVLHSAYQYLGYNNSTTVQPVILFTGLTTASTYIYNYSWTFYFL